jgi:hypothetical protein
MAGRFFSGRECWVYRAQTPSELCGHHPELIEGALCREEPEYLLYSPLRETNRGPFGLQGPQGSHAVALTNTSLIVSRDSHQPGARRSMRRIPLTDVLTLAIGEALTLGWLVVQFVEDRAVATEVVFFQSSGIAHFRELVRLWLRREAIGSSHIEGRANWRERLAASPVFLAGQVGPLIDDWRGIETVDTPETWDGAGKGCRCTSASTLIILSDAMAIFAESERPLRRGMLVFGVNVVGLPRRAVAQVALQLPGQPASAPTSLTFTLARAGIGHRVSRDLALSTDVAGHVMARLASHRLAREDVA